MKDIFYQNKNLDKVLNALFFIVAYSIPFSYVFNSLAIFLLFIFSFFWFDKKKYTLKNKLLFFLIIVFFCLQIMTIFYSEFPNKAISTVTRSIVFLVFPITFINLSDLINIKKVLLACIGLILGVITIMVSIHLSIIKDIVFNGFKVSGIFTSFIREDFINKGMVNIHAPYFSMLTVMSIIFLYFIEFKSYNWLKWLVISYLGISLFQISTIVSLSLLAFFLIYASFNNFNYKKLKILSVILILVVGIVYANHRHVVSRIDKDFFLNRIETIINKGDPTREENWKSVIKVISDNFFFWRWR